MERPHASFRAKLLCTLLAFLLFSVFFLATASAATEWYVASETMTTGTSDGFGNQGSDDANVNIKTEADAGGGATVSAMILPNADVSVQWDYEGPIGGCPHEPGATHHYDRINAVCPAEPDGNASYITSTIATVSSDTDTFTLSDLALPGATVIISVEAFAWVRSNLTGNTNHVLTFDLDDPSAGDCTPGGYSTANIRQAFVNRSNGWLNSCDGDAWTSADIDGLNLMLVFSNNQAATTATLTATYAGVIVTYIELDYEVDFTSEFNNVAGISLTLVVECTTTDADQALNVLYLAVNRGTITCDGARNPFALPTDVGTIQVQLTSLTTSGDASQSTITFDVLILETSQQGGDDGDGTNPVILFDFVCNSSMKSIDCTLSLKAYVAGLAFSRTVWYVDDEYSADGESVTPLSHRANLASFAFPRDNRTIKVEVYFNNNQKMTLEKDVEQDNTWLLLVIMFSVVGLALMMIAVSMRRKKRRTRRVIVRHDPRAEQRMRIVEGTRR